MTSSTYTLSNDAYTKIVQHAVKYPSSSVSGLLLARVSTLSSPQVNIPIAIPLFHHWTSLSPMLQIALQLVSTYAKKEGLQIVGLYHANEKLNDHALPPTVAKTLNKIREVAYPQAFALLVDNEKLSTKFPSVALLPYVYSDNSWKHVRNAFTSEATTPGFKLQDSSAQDTTAASLSSGAYSSLVDFDDHLEDPQKAWLA